MQNNISISFLCILLPGHVFVKFILTGVVFSKFSLCGTLNCMSNKTSCGPSVYDIHVDVHYQIKISAQNMCTLKQTQLSLKHNLVNIIQRNVVQQTGGCEAEL